MRKCASLFATLMLFCALAYGQVRPVTGRVTDESGNAIPFATVIIKGTNQGVSADQNGRFSINAKTGDVLVFSTQGGTTREVAVDAGSVVNASLQMNNATLTEVVVTGAYNTRRTSRSATTNSQVVNAEQLNVIRQPNVNNALAGKVSGIQVRSQSSAALGRETGVRLRGETGLSGGGQVIYVVDGTILPNSDDINIDDIESVSVLQGPAAAAQFGSQGANGAIVITLKKGRRTKGVGVNLNLGGQWENVYILPNYQNSYAGGSSADLMKYTWKAGDPAEWKALDGKYYHDYSDDASWGPRMVGQEYIPWYSWYGGHSRSFTTSRLTPQVDNARDFFQTGILSNNSVSFTKSTDVMNMRFSYGNVYTRGILPTTSLGKNTLSFATDVNVTPKLTLGANINFVTQKLNGDINDEYSNQSTGSFNQWFHRNVDMGIMKELRGLKTPDGVFASWNHANPNSFDASNPRAFYAGNYWYNFYTWMDLAKSTQDRSRLFGDLSLSYKVTNDITVRATYRRQDVNTFNEERFSSSLATSGLQTFGNEPRARGSYKSLRSNSLRQNYELFANYTRRFNDFQVNLNAGTDIFSWDFKNNGGETQQGLNVPDLYTLANSKSTATIINDRLKEKYRALMAFGTLGYKNFVSVDFSLRNDWFSTLPPANNDVLSKSFGASFVFSDLLKNVSWLSFGKLRGAWGEIPQALGVRATEFGAYRYPGFNYSVGQFQWNGNFLMSTPNQLVDSAIRGAVKRQKEIGLELRFFKNRLGLSTTFWDGTEEDLPLAVTINGASGFNSKLINTGKISKKGVELQLSAVPVNMTNLRWDINATWAKLTKNRVDYIAPGLNRIAIEGVWGTTAPYLVHDSGKNWGQIYGNGMKRINGKPVLDADGFYTNDANVYYGSVLPEFTGGIQNSFQIMKRFSVNVNIDYQVGGKFVSLSDMWGSYSGLTARTATINDKGNPIRDAVANGGGVHVFGVDKDGKDVSYYVEAQDYFHNMYNKLAFDEFVYDLTFVKLRELAIGYDIPVNKIGIGRWANNATITLVARNPVLIYAKTKDFDPSEISNISGETGNFPGTRGFGFNLRVGF